MIEAGSADIDAGRYTTVAIPEDEGRAHEDMEARLRAASPSMVDWSIGLRAWEYAQQACDVRGQGVFGAFSSVDQEAPGVAGS